MKQIFSIFLMTLLALFGVETASASPSSLKFKIEGDASNVVISYPGCDAVEIVDGECTVTPPNAAMPIFLNSEPDDMTAITASDGSVWWDARAGAPSFPLNSYTVFLSNIGNGVEYLTIQINGAGGGEIEQPTDKTIRVNGSDKLAVKFGPGYVDRTDEDGWAITVSPMNRLDLQVEVQSQYVSTYEISDLKLNGENYSLDHDGQIAFFDVYTLANWADGTVLDVTVSEKVVEPEPVVFNGLKLVIDGNAENIRVMNPFQMGSYIEFTDNTYTFDTKPTNSFPVFLDNDAKITNITADDDSALWRAGYGPTFPIENMWTIDPSYINAGATVTIELDGEGGGVEVPTTKTIYVNAPEQCAVKLGEGEIGRDDIMNRFAVTLEPANRLELRVQIQQQYATQYKISGAYLNGNAFSGTGSSDDLNLFVDDSTLSTWEDGSVLSIIVAERTANDDDLTFNVNIVGDPAMVTLRYSDGSGNLAIDSNENELYCSPDNNVLVFEHAVFGSALYNVTVDGDGEVVQQGTKWVYTVSDGDIVTVTVESEEPVEGEPVTFTFTNDDTEGVVMRAVVSGNDKEWNTPGFSLPEGTILDMMFDIYAYDIASVTCNNVDVTARAVTGYYSVTVPAGGLSFVIDATPKAPTNVTINVVGDPKGVRYAYGWSCNEPTTLSQASTQVTVSSDYSVINIVNNPGYTIDKIEASDGSTYSNDCYIEVQDGDVYTVYVTKEASLGSVTVFVEDTNFVYLKLGWDLNMPTEDGYIYNDNLESGYSEIDYRNGGQFSVTGYPAPIVYVNNENAEVWDPTHSWKIYDAFNMQPLNPNDVVKVYKAIPQIFNVEYNISEKANVKVYHDKVRHIESPAAHEEHIGTEICIKPVTDEIMLLSEDDEMEEATKLVVTVNDKNIEANEAGEYVFTVTDHSNVSVTKVTSGINGVSVESGNGTEAVYNLQGIKVNADKLTKGVYIKGGKKILVK